MYQITYKKRNGSIFYRIRNTLPTHSVGEVTSMGWTVIDIKYNFKNNYYSFAEYKQLLRKHFKYCSINRNIKKFLKRYATTILLVIIIPLYLIEII